jgi:hypothetical protein
MRTFDRLVRPAIGLKSIYLLKRSEIVGMLDEIEDRNGPVMADHVLAYVRKAFNWQATRDGQGHGADQAEGTHADARAR